VRQSAVGSVASEPAVDPGEGFERRRGFLADEEELNWTLLDRHDVEGLSALLEPALHVLRLGRSSVLRHQQGCELGTYLLAVEASEDELGAHLFFVGQLDLRTQEVQAVRVRDW
jgi:hypothetical protein